MLIEKYMNVEAVFHGWDDNDPGESSIEEVYVPDDEIRHYIDTYLSAEDVLNFAKQIDPEWFKENPSDIDTAYDILTDEFDEHDDIPDLADLNEYIQDCVQRDYEEEAKEIVIDRNSYDDNGMRQSDFI